MNFFLAWNIFSFRREVAYVASAFLFVIMLPIVAVIVLTQTGINIVSDTLAEVNVVTHLVELKNPSDGSIYKTLNGPFAWPASGVFTLEFAQTSKFQIFHTGLDIAGKLGDPITPFMDGKVIYAGEISWGYGKHIVIDHGDNVTSTYAHLNDINVNVDQEVMSGDIIGTRGNTGWSTGPHLHFEIRVFGIPVNPRVFLGK